MQISLLAVILLLAPSSGWTQKQSSTQGQNPQQPQAIVRSPDSTAEDNAVPMCPAKFDDGVETMNQAKGDESIAPPKLIRSVEAKFSDQARRKKKLFRKFEGHVQVTLVVDKQGEPQDLCLAKSLGDGLDANAAIAVRQWRFAPATKDGERVPIRLTVDIKYENY